MQGEVIILQLAGFVLAPLLPGVINKTKAFFAGKTGAPLVQPYYDLWRLLRKGAVYSEATTWVFRLAPVVGLAATSVALMILPAGSLSAPLSFSGDLFLFAGLLALARFSTVASALDTGSSFEGMGASREVAFGALAEPSLFLGLAALALVTQQVSLSGMLSSIGWSDWSSAVAPALAMAATGIFVLLLAENCRIPVDDPNTHLELTMIHEVMVLDHSGPDFAYISYMAALKMWLFASLVAGILTPFSLANTWVFGALHLGFIIIIGVAVGVIESVTARLRMMQVPHLLIGGGMLGVLAVALARVLG